MKAIYKDYYGDEMRYFYGVVVLGTESDPLHLGRVKVRIFGIHSEDTTEISVSDLPWATVVSHTSHPGTVHHWHVGIQSGARVIGFFLDGKHSQQPVIIGSVPYNPKSLISHEHVIEDFSTSTRVVEEKSVQVEQQTDRVVDNSSSKTNFRNIPLTSGSNIEKCYNRLFDWFITTGSSYPEIHAAALCGQIINEAGPAADPLAGPARDGIEGTTTRWGAERSYGLMQWNEASGRFGGLETFAQTNSTNWRELIVQLEFIKHELSTSASVGRHECYSKLSSLLNTTNVREASDYLIRTYTIPLVAVNYKLLKAGNYDTLKKFINKSTVNAADKTKIIDDYEAELDERVTASKSVMENFGK
jgi:hypothetical protein